MCSTGEAAFEYYAEHADTEKGRSLQRIFEGTEGYAGKLAALSESICKTEDSVSKETMDLLLPKDLTMSPTRLKTFLGCSIAHYCSYFLKLGDDSEIKFGTLDSGSLIHILIKELTEAYIKDNGIADQTDEQLADWTLTFVEDYCKTFFGIDFSKKGFGRLYARIKRLCAAAVPVERDLLNEYKFGRFKPYATELRIKNGEKIEPTAIDAGGGRTVKLTGQIDRIDTFEENGRTYIKLVDYKSGSGSDFSPKDLENMEGIQLFIYMIDAAESDKTFADPVPAALYYMDGVNSAVTVKVSEDLGKRSRIKRGGVALDESEVRNALGAAVYTLENISRKDESGKITLKTSAEFDAIFEQVKKGIGETVTKMAGGKLVPTEKIPDEAPCKYCEYMPFCRYTEKKKKW